MALINTHELTPSAVSAMGEEQRLQTYNALDCCVTLEVFEELSTQFNSPPAIYQFEKALQGPYLDMMLRGFRVDTIARTAASGALRARIEALQARLNAFSMAVWDRPLNPASPKQLKDFFYSAMRLPEVWLSQRGERKLSTNREALEKLEIYLHARPIIGCILAIRDLSKQLQVFETDIDGDGRFRTSYNIAGTETGRPSSSENAFGTGGNAQNIAPALRFVFVADPGYKLVNIDLEQVEARDVGFFIGCLFDDWAFLDACESGDLHSANARLIWPELPWTGNLKQDRIVAEKPFYRDFSYRDMAKRGSHLCLTEDHEVLTPYGWVPITEKPIQIMAWNEFESSFEVVERWTDELYSGDLHEFDGNSMKIRMTSEHRIPYKSDQKPGTRIKTRKASDGPGIMMPLGDNYVGGNLEVPARLIAAFMSDGRQASTNRMHFHLRKRRKILRLIELCQQYGYEFEYRSEQEIISVVGSLPKRTGAFMFEWTQSSLRDFLDEYKYWDGHQSATAIALFSVDKEHLEWIQTFGRILGIGGTLSHSQTTTTFSNSSKEYRTDYYRLQQNNRKWANGNSISWSKSPVINVRVLCPTVQSSFFYVRRKGKIFVTGNSNYFGTAYTAARHLKVPQPIMEEFQARYCRGRPANPAKGLPAITPAYPGIPRYWQWVSTELQSTHQLTTPFGRRRHFFGRPNDDTTLREAIAFLPQSTTADRTNLGLYRVWRHMPDCQLLAQTFDSLTFQVCDTPRLDDLVAEALERIRIELIAPNGRSYIVPGEASVGFNWGKQSPTNPDGLAKWSPGADRRTRTAPLQRVMA